MKNIVGVERFHAGICLLSNGAREWESGCNIIIMIAKTYSQDRKTIEVDLACGGEGMTWRSKQIWHLETIERRRSCVMAERSRTQLRDDSGRKIRSGNEFDDSTIGIYLEGK